MPLDLSWTDGGAAPATDATAPAAAKLDLSWTGGDVTATPAAAPAADPVDGIDALSTSGRSYQTLVSGKDFVAAGSKDREKLFDQWERTDALARAGAAGLKLEETKAAIAQRRREFVATYGDQNVIDGAKDIGVSVLSGFAGLVKNIGDVYGLTSGNTYNLVSEAGKQAQEYWNANKSDILKSREKDQAKRVAEADGIVQEFWEALKGTATDPTLATSFIAQQLPQMLPGLLAGRAIAGAGAAAGLAQNTATKLGVAGAVSTGALLQGADVGSDTFDAALKAAKKATPGLTDAEYQTTALQTARQAAVAAGLVSLALGMVPGASDFEKVLVTGKAGKGGIGAALKAAAKEGFVSELPEEAGGKFGSNLALQQIDPTQSLTQGVGEAGALGLLGGATLGAAGNVLASTPAPAAPPTALPPATPSTPPPSAGSSTSAPTDLVLPAGATVLRDLGNGDLAIKLADRTEVIYTAEAQAKAVVAKEQAAEAAAIATALAGTNRPPIEPLVRTEPPVETPAVVLEPGQYAAAETETFLPTLQEGETNDQAALIAYRPAETAAEATSRLADALLRTGDPASQELKSAVVEGHLNAYLGYLVNEINNERYTGGIDPDVFVAQLNDELDAALIAKGVLLDPARTAIAATVVPTDPALSRIDQGSRYLGDGKYLSEAAYLDRITGKEKANGSETQVQENTLAGVVQEAERIEPRGNDGTAQSAQRTDTGKPARKGKGADGRAVRGPAAVPATTTGQEPARPPRPGPLRSRLTGAAETNRSTAPGNQQLGANQQPAPNPAPSTTSDGAGLPAGVSPGSGSSGAARAGATSGATVAPPRPPSLRKQGPRYVSPVAGNPVVRYNEGTKGYKPVFASTYDRDAYMAQSAKVGKSDPAIMKAVEAAGITAEEFALHGAYVKRQVQAEARAGQAGEAKTPATVPIPALSGITADTPAPEIVKKKRLGTKQGGAVGTGLLQPVADAVQGIPNKAEAAIAELTRIDPRLVDNLNTALFNQKQLMVDNFGLNAQEFDDASQTALNRNTTLEAQVAEQIRQVLRVRGELAAGYNNVQGKPRQSINARKNVDVPGERALSSDVFINGANIYDVATWVLDGNQELKQRRVDDINELTTKIEEAQRRLDGLKQAVETGEAAEAVVVGKVRVEKQVKALTKQRAALQEGLDLFNAMDDNSTYQDMLTAAEAIVTKRGVGKRAKLGLRRDAGIREAARELLMGATAGLSTFDARQLIRQVEDQFGADVMKRSHEATMEAQLAIRGIQEQYKTYLPGEFFDLATDPYAQSRLPTEFAEDSRTGELSNEKITTFREGSRTPQRAAFEESLNGAAPPVDALLGMERFGKRVAYQSGVGAMWQYLANTVRDGTSTGIKLMPDADYQIEYRGVLADEAKRAAGENNQRIYERRLDVTGDGTAETKRALVRLVFDSGNITEDSRALVALYNTINGTAQQAVREFGTGRGDATVQDAKDGKGAKYAPATAAIRELVNLTQRGLTYMPFFPVYNQELSDALSKQANMLRSGILEKADGTKLNAGAVKSATAVIKQNTTKVARSLADGIRGVAFNVGEALDLPLLVKGATPYQAAAAQLFNRKKSTTPEAKLMQRLIDDGVLNLRANTHLDVSNDANVRRSLRAGAKGDADTPIGVRTVARMSAYVEWVQRQRTIATMSIAARTVDAFMKEGATYESATAAYRYAYDETKVGSLVTSAWASNVSFLAASAAEVGSFLRSYTAQPLTPSQVQRVIGMTAVGIGVSTMLKLALQYTSVMLAGGAAADEPDEEKRKAFGSKQQQQRGTSTNDTLLAFGWLFSMPSSYNPGIVLEKAVAREMVNALDGRGFDGDKIAMNMLKGLAGPFGSYRFGAIAESDRPQFDLFLATSATMIGANPVTEAFITLAAQRDVFGKDIRQNRYARTGDVDLPSDVTTTGRVAGRVSDLLGITVGENTVKSLLANFPYLRGPLEAVGLNRFAKPESSEFTARAEWKRVEADLLPLIEKANLERKRAQRAAGEKENNASFAEKDRPDAAYFKDKGLSDKDAQKLEIYYAVQGNTKPGTVGVADKARLATKLGRAENDVIYARAINDLREIDRQ